MRIYPIRQLVKDILKKFPVTRDNDWYLYYYVWIQETTGNIILVDMLTDQLSKPSTITRAKRDLQKKFPRLRGKNYCKKYKKQFDEMCCQQFI